jgi:hypothetical protein
MDGTPNATARRNAGYSRVGPLAPRSNARPGYSRVGPVSSRRTTRRPRPASAPAPVEVQEGPTLPQLAPTNPPTTTTPTTAASSFSRAQCIRFRRVWSRLHLSAAARAAGSIDADDFKTEVSKANLITDTICARCGTHFREHVAPTLQATVAEHVERAVYDVRAQIGRQSNPEYRAPDVSEVISSYRQEHARLVRDSVRLHLRMLA